MSTQTQFKNENISVELIRKPGCLIHLEVLVSPEATQAAYQKAIKMVSKEVSIPGFRKGKAPETTIVQNFAKHIDREWRDLLLNTSLEEAIKLTKIPPFNKRSLNSANIKSISKDQGSNLNFEYEASPEIPTISATELSITPIQRKSITEKEITETLENLCMQRAEWIDLNRAVQEGDYVDIDIETVEEGRSICKNSRFAVAPEKMGAWMRCLLIGKSAGETVEGMSEKEEHAEECHECEEGHEGHVHAHDDNFIPTLCRITLHSVKQATPALLDEKLAKHFGAESVELLKERVTSNLNKEADDSYKNSLRRLMQEAIINTYHFDVPHSLLTESQGGHSHGASDSLEKDLRFYFLAQKAAHDFHIEVSQDEVLKELMRQMWLQQLGENSIDTSLDPKEMQSRLHLQILVDKTLDFLIDKVLPT